MEIFFNCNAYKELRDFLNEILRIEEFVGLKNDQKIAKMHPLKGHVVDG